MNKGNRLSWIRRVLGIKEEGSGKPESATLVIGTGTGISIASCCNPIPGDPVIGIKAPDGTVTVHKKSCSVAENIAAVHGDWVVVPKWQDQTEDHSFLVRISLRGLDRKGMVNEITSYLSIIMGVNMRQLTLSADSGVFEGFIDMYVTSKDILEKIIKKLSSIDGIENISRTAL